MPGTFVVDQFEDGDVAGWNIVNDGTGTFTASSSDPAEGGYHAEHQATDDDDFREYLHGNKNPVSVEFWVKIVEIPPDSENPYYNVQIKGDRGVEGISLTSDDSGGILVQLDYGTTTEWVLDDRNKWYKYRLYNLDWNDYTYDFEVSDGSTTFISETGLTLGGYYKPEYVDGVQLQCRPPSGLTTSAYVDAIEYGVPAPPRQPLSVNWSAADNDTNEISWDPDTSGGTIDNHEVEVSIDGSSWSSVATVSAGTTSYTHSISDTGDTYQYRVRSCNDLGCSDWTESETADTAPSSLYSSSHDTETITLDWTEASEADGYEILRAESSGSSAGDYGVVGTTTAPPYTDSSLENGELYYYRVRATFDGADQTPSALTNEAAETTDLPAPTLTVAASAEGEMTASWTKEDNSSDGSWTLYRSTDGSKGTQLQSWSDLSVGEFTDTGLNDGERYYYTIRHSTNHTDADTQDAAVTVLPADGSVTALPESNTEVGLSWTANQNNGSRDINYKESGSSSWNQYSSVSIETESVQITGLKEDTEYDFGTEVSTEHVSKGSSIASARTFLFMTREVGSFSQPMSMTSERLISTSMFVESHSGVLSSSVGRNTDYSRKQESHLKKIASSAEILVSYLRGAGSFSDKMTSFTYTDRTSLEMIDYQVDWNDDQATWYTNWFQESRITGDEDNLALRAKVVEGSKEPAAKVQVQYDRNGDGIPDEETRIIDIGKAENLHQIDDIPISETGQYRLKIMDYSGFNSLISIDFGIVH